MAAMYRFALRPWWVVSHVLVLALVVAMVSLGLWQLDRLDQRRAQNERVEAALALDPLRAADLVDAEADDVEFRRVELVGGDLLADAVLVDNRTMGGTAGAWFIRPYRLSTGGGVLVNLGFVPYGDGLSVEVPDRPEGLESSEAIAVDDADRSCAEVASDVPGVVARFGCVDTAAMAAALGLDDVAAVEVRLVAADRPVDETAGPRVSPLSLPETDEGPHLSYAVQWFIFTTIAVVGYPLVLRKVARSRT